MTAADRHVALGAVLAAEYLYEERIRRLQAERDQALLQLDRERQAVDRLMAKNPPKILQPMGIANLGMPPGEEPGNRDERYCHEHKTQRWACGPLGEQCFSMVLCPDDCESEDPHWHDDLGRMRAGLIPPEV